MCICICIVAYCFLITDQGNGDNAPGEETPEEAVKTHPYVKLEDGTTQGVPGEHGEYFSL